MGEYYFYGFANLSRRLLKHERDALRALSEHATIGLHSMRVSYTWGWAKFSPAEVLADHFDVFFHLSNNGEAELHCIVDEHTVSLELIEELREVLAGTDSGIAVERSERGLMLRVSTYDENEEHSPAGDRVWDGYNEIETLAAASDLVAAMSPDDPRVFLLPWLGAVSTGHLEDAQKLPLCLKTVTTDEAWQTIAGLFTFDWYLVQAVSHIKALSITTVGELRAEARRLVREEKAADEARIKAAELKLATEFVAARGGVENLEQTISEIARAGRNRWAAVVELLSHARVVLIDEGRPEDLGQLLADLLAKHGSVTTLTSLLRDRRLLL
jgi:hypothetical protein